MKSRGNVPAEEEHASTHSNTSYQHMNSNTTNASSGHPPPSMIQSQPYYSYGRGPLAPTGPGYEQYRFHPFERDNRSAFDRNPSQQPQPPPYSTATYSYYPPGPFGGPPREGWGYDQPRNAHRSAPTAQSVNPNASSELRRSSFYDPNYRQSQHNSNSSLYNGTVPLAERRSKSWTEERGPTTVYERQSSYPGDLFPKATVSNKSNEGPYTSAQQNTDKPLLAATQHVVPKPTTDSGLAKTILPAVDSTSSTEEVAKATEKKANVKAPPTTFHMSMEADARAYKAVEGREGATSPSQIESNRRDDVTSMGCTCKKSKCLKLYCVCFGASVTCGPKCRCLDCRNTPQHSQMRKDAIRSILIRNPSAFDTKFKKFRDGGSQQTGTHRSLAHKLGCKCRKSFCMKKYCECYNAGVKCSASCRCIGCKNMPPGESKSGNSDQTAQEIGAKSGRIMDAAQNLAFLKHTPEKGRSVKSATVFQDISSIPSLAPSDSTTSPDDDPNKTHAKPKPQADVSSLLLAAYAMTELQSKDVPRDAVSTEAPATPDKAPVPQCFRSPKRKILGGKKSSASQLTRQDDQENLYLPEDRETDMRSMIEDATVTPGSERRKVKRTRVGTIERKAKPASGANGTSSLQPGTFRQRQSSLSSDEEDAGRQGESPKSDPEESNERNDVFRTPKHRKPQVGHGALTPVSARCIDFQQMGMTEHNNSKGSPKKVVTTN